MIDLHERAATKGDNKYDHGEKICEPDPDRLPKLRPEIVVCLRVIEDINTGCA